MAKQPITEKIVETHSLTTEGYLNLENMTMEIADMGEVEICELLSNFNGKFVKLSIQAKEEKDVTVETEAEVYEEDDFE